MNLEYLTFINLMLLTRLVYLVNDGPLPTRTALALGVIQLLLLALVFRFNLAFSGAALTIVVMTAAALIPKHLIGYTRSQRLIGLLLLLVLPGYLGSFGGGFVFSQPFDALLAHMQGHLPLLEGLDRPLVTRLGAALFGLLLLANETNIGMRVVFHQLRLEPAQAGKTGEIDQQEYNAGRVIGILERWLMFQVVLLSGDMGALGFIIAAKGLARLKQLEDRQFAEYMLVGTLLSAVSAVLIGYWVKGLWMA